MQMNKKPKTTAVIVAGGSGKRMSSSLPKQFILLNQKPIIIHTLEVFDKCDAVDEIIIVCVEGHIDYCTQLIEKYSLKKVKKIIPGGSERLFSVYNAINFLHHDKNLEYICVHDAVRPFVTTDVINRTIKECEDNDGCICGVKAKDTIKIVDQNNRELIKETIPRENIFLAYTPQTFKRKILEQSYKNAIKENFFGTDDASICEKYGYKIKIIESNPENIKLTTQNDLVLAETFMNNKHTSIN